MPWESSALTRELGPIRTRFDDQLLSWQADSAEIHAFGCEETQVACEFEYRRNRLTARDSLQVGFAAFGDGDSVFEMKIHTLIG